MKIACIGGGPAGLYLAVLLKRADPSHEIQVYERNQPDDTFGWGVVFSSETLSHIEAADVESYRAIRAAFRYWDDIETIYQGQRLVSTGHGFCGLSRRSMLNILQRRCAELGVPVQHGIELPDSALDSLKRSADLVVVSDGINSRFRDRLAHAFEPRVTLGTARFTWLGSDLPLSAFTFIYKPSPHGLFVAHAYPFDTPSKVAPGSPVSTFIVECHQDTFHAAGLDRADEAQTIAFCEQLFANELRGHRLFANRSLWRTFPEVTCARWSHENVVLLGDAAHSAHFSIGSGTKLAMEDAIALAATLTEMKTAAPPGLDGVPGAVRAYEARRRPDVLRLQRAARVSQAWFQNVARYHGQPPLQFVFNQLTRSLRISWDNLQRRDPALVAQVARWYQDSQDERIASHADTLSFDSPQQARAPLADSIPPRDPGDALHPITVKPLRQGATPPPMFTPFTVRGLRLRNRVVVSPMCMYSAEDGAVEDWHLVHLGSRAIGGAGLVLAEMTAVSREGRISQGCAGLYRDEHIAAWRRVVDFVHRRSDARIGVQLGHAGRKGSATVPWTRGGERPLGVDEGAWTTIGPSPLAYDVGWPVPRVMDRAAMDQVRDDHVRAARRARAAGFDWIELHMAHGYLLASFLSPLTNRRDDAYGGALGGRLRFPLEILAAVRAAVPDLPLSVRISACDWAPGGLSEDDAVAIARALHANGADLIDVSSGGTVPHGQPAGGRMYQVPFADRIRHEAGVPTMAVGNLFDGDACNTVLAAGRADLCLLARPHLRDPYFVLHEAERYGFAGQPWPPQYLPARPRPR